MLCYSQLNFIPLLFPIDTSFMNDFMQASGIFVNMIWISRLFLLEVDRVKMAVISFYFTSLSQTTISNNRDDLLKRNVKVLRVRSGEIMEC